MKVENLDDSALAMGFGLVPWDTAACGFPVAQIDSIELRDPARAESSFGAFESWRDSRGVELVSCRLPHDALRESMFLETRGFRFIEMVMQPEIDLTRRSWLPDPELEVAAATAEDLPEIEETAAESFSTDRFHLDFRLPERAGGERYRRWVRNTPSHGDQRLLKVTEAGQLVSFFVVQTDPDRSCYWHLNAIAPGFQGRGYGKRVWRAMIAHHCSEGAASLASMIAVRNTPVVNLYAGLGFRFRPPQSTFHWVRGRPW